MSCGELTGDLKTNREGSLTKHVGFVYAYAKKAKHRKVMLRKVVTSRKSKNHNRQSKTRHICV